MSCRVGKFKNLSSGYRIVKGNITSGRKRYRICNSNICSNTEIVQKSISELKSSRSWVKPLMDHVRSQLAITGALTSKLKEISGILNSNNCKSLTEFNNSTDCADLSYHWSRVTYHLSKISFNPECALKLRLTAVGYRDTSMVDCLTKLLALPDLNHITRELKKAKPKAFDGYYINLLSTQIEYLEEAGCSLKSTLEVLQSYLIVFFDQVDLTLSSTKTIGITPEDIDSFVGKENMSLSPRETWPYFPQPENRSNDHHLISTGSRSDTSKHLQIYN